jgi:hypothetical protein
MRLCPIALLPILFVARVSATDPTGTWHLSKPENRDGKFEARRR